MHRFWTRTRWIRRRRWRRIWTCCMTVWRFIRATAAQSWRTTRASWAPRNPNSSMSRPMIFSFSWAVCVVQKSGGMVKCQRLLYECVCVCFRPFFEGMSHSSSQTEIGSIHSHNQHRDATFNTVRFTHTHTLVLRAHLKTERILSGRFISQPEKHS